MQDTSVRSINDAIGKEAFARLAALPEAMQQELAAALMQGQVALHQDGYLGFTVDSSQGWSNEGFES